MEHFTARSEGVT